MPPSTSRNIEILPTFTAVQLGSIDAQTGGFVDGDPNPEGGVTADFTFNPDFSQIESDEPQIEVNQRFELFFPELRPFFLEGAEIFNFSGPVNLVHTRTIVDPKYGAKLTGKAGNTTIGVMYANDEAAGDLADTTDPRFAGKDAKTFVGRVRYDLYAESYVGAIYTDRQLLDSYNRVAGIDTNFRVGDTHSFGIRAAGSEDRDLDGLETSGYLLNANLRKNGRNLSYNLAWYDLSPDFNTEVGFLVRTDQRWGFGNVNYLWWPESWLISWGPQFTYMRGYNFDGVLEDETASTGVQFNFAKNIRTNFNASSITERFGGIDFQKTRFNTFTTVSTDRRYGLGSSLLLLLAVLDVTSERWGRAGVWLALAGLARPEAAIVTVVVVTTVLMTRRSGRLAASRLMLPSIAAGLLIGGYHVWASGSPLPATFHAKSEASLVMLPVRVWLALRDFFPGVPAFTFGVGWIALFGLLPLDGRRLPARVYLPCLAGFAFLLANLYVAPPRDLAAFYYQRYLLPAVPLITPALVVGAHWSAQHIGRRAADAQLATLLVLALVGTIRTTAPVSRHLHNDVRNINEVQRTLGEWLEANMEPGTRIAASDAGAVRYFSDLPTLDLLGLNTPQMLNPSEKFLHEHPVTAVALMPAWFADAGSLTQVFEATTRDYTVTSHPEMARQTVLVHRADDGQPTRVRARFTGFRDVGVDVVAWNKERQPRTTPRK